MALHNIQVSEPQQLRERIHVKRKSTGKIKCLRPKFDKQSPANRVNIVVKVESAAQRADTFADSSNHPHPTKVNRKLCIQGVSGRSQSLNRLRDKK